jgi:hypothetical protein
MMGLGEPAQAEKFNRAFVALLDNTDDLDDRVSHDIAQPVTYRINLVVPTSTITVGTGGAIDPTADGYTTLFMGSTGWGNTLDNRRKLFSVTGALRDAVLVDNFEVSVDSVSGASVSDGFVDIASTLRTITLSQTIPAGGYYIGFFCGSTAGTIHEAALCELTRGMQEVPGAAGKRFGVVCAINANEGPADYLGVNSVLQAVADGYEHIFIRAGAYGPYAAPLTLDGITLHGAGMDSVTIQTNSYLTVANGGGIEDLSISTPTSTASTYVSMSNQSTIKNVDLDGLEIQCFGQNIVVENIRRCGGVTGALTLGASTNVSIRNLRYDCSYSTVPLITFSTAQDVIMENVRPYVFGTVVDEYCVYFSPGVSPSRLHFRNCYFETGNAIALLIDNDLHHVTWDNCTFRSQQQVVDTPTVIEAVGSYFRNCRFENTAATWYRTPFVQLMSLIEPAAAAFPKTNLSLEECYFFDRWCTGHTDASNPGGIPAGGGTPHHVIHFAGLTAKGIKIDRYGLDYLVMDIPAVEIDHCMIDGLHFTQQYNPDGMVPFVYGTEGSSMIHVTAQSHIRDMSVYAQIDCNTGTNPVTLSKGLIYLEGGDYNQVISPDNPDGKTVVDGLFLYLSTSSPSAGIVFPSASTNAPLTIGSAVLVRGFTWPKTSTCYTQSGQSYAMVLILGSRVTFEEFDINLDNDTRNDFLAVIRAGNAITDSAIRIGPGKIYALPDVGGGFDYPYYFVHAVCTNLVMNAVEMVFDGSRVSALVPCIHLGGTQYAKLTNNHLQIRGDTPDSGASYYDAILFPIAALPTTPAAPAGGGIALGNVINVTGSSPAAHSPIINPPAVTGNSLNIMVLDGVTDPGV